MIDERELVERVAPLLDSAAVWLDPPEELADEVVDSVQSMLD